MTLQGFTIDVYDVGDDPIQSFVEEDTNWIIRKLRLDSLQRLRRHNGSMVAVDVETPPTGPANSTNSGCQTNDFDAFPAGSIAIIQRGSCTFQEKPPTLKTQVPVPWSYSTRDKMDGKVYLMEP